MSFELVVTGDPGQGNPSSVSDQQPFECQAEGVVRFRGHIEEIEKGNQQADVVVLPSCREAAPRDAAPLADAIRMLASNEPMRDKLGMAANAKDGKPTSARRPGSLVISLDFELAWGTRGRPASKYVGPFIEGTRPAIKGLLKLFEEYEIPATWAIVGALLLGGSERKRHTWLQDERFADIPAGNFKSQPQWYAEDVLEWLVEHPVPQEIGCHTLTHLFVKKDPASRDAMREELRLFGELCHDMNLAPPKSFVFPKAMMAHVDLLAEAGYRCFRGPENGWFEQMPGRVVPAALRMADAILSRPPQVEHPTMHASGVWMIPSSQFYSPFYSVGNHVSVAQRVRKAVKGLRRATDTGGVYHLWTHPFNLGVRTPELLSGLRTILQEARSLAAEGKLQIITMGGLADQMDRSHGIERIDDHEHSPKLRDVASQHSRTS